MKNLKALKNRILRTVSMLCVLVTLFCAGTISASADEISGYTVYNFLSGNQYDFYVNGSLKSTGDVPRTWINNANTASIKFTVPWTNRFDKIVVTIASWKVPTSLGLNELSFQLVGSFYDSANRYISQWVIDNANVGFADLIDVNFSWSSSCSGDLTLLSLCGYFDPVDLVTTFDARLQAAQLTANGELYLEDVGSQNNASVPYVYDYEGNFVTVTFSYGYLSLYIRPDDRVYDFADKLSLLMTSIGSTSFGAYLVEGQFDEFVTDIPLISKEVTGSYGGVMFNEDMEWKLNQYLVEFDLSGLDLRDKTIVIDCHIEPMPTDDFSSDREALYGTVLGISMTPEVAENPWYLDFSRWLKVQYNSITAAVSNAAAGISSSIGSLSSSIGTHFSNLSTWISTQTTSLSNGLTAVKDSVVTWGGNVQSAITAWGTNIVNTLSSFLGSINANLQSFANNVRDYFTSLKNHLTSLLNPDPDAGEDFKEDSQNNAAILGGLNDQMNSVVKPDLSGSGNISGIITPSQMSSYTTVLATVVNAPYIGQVVMLSLILSLAGYVLFGKR